MSDALVARARSLNRLRLTVLVLVAVIAAGTLVAANQAFKPDYVQLSVRNQTPYDVDVAVSADGRLWLPVGVAARHATVVWNEVADQGARWHIALRTQGVSAGEFTLQRTQLRADRWTVDIPPQVGERLRSRGVPLPP